MRTAPSPAPAARRDDVAAVDGFLQLLARAVRQFHTYPPASPMCADAVSACHKAFVPGERDRVILRVTPGEFIVDGESIGAGTIIERELVQRLHAVRVAGLEFDRNATARHLSHFCTALLRCEALAETKITLAELLAEQGVDTIVTSMARRPEVLNVGAPPAAACELVEHEHRRRDAALATGPVNHLYPPEKGWVRLDPAARLGTVSLGDLALLVDTPADVATMLLRLTDDDPVGPEERKSALERKFSDVTLLFSSLDPKLARVMFSKLARAVLELDPARRTNLLRRTILPGMLDGRADGAVLRDFPDVDLADSLCLLFELETAAPEMLSTALNRLDLPEERRKAVLPLLDARLQGTRNAARPAEERAIDRLARRLVQIDGSAAKDFSEFAAYDLAIDQPTTAALAAAREAIAGTDLAATELRFLANLVRLEPNPGTAGAFLRRALTRLTALERADRWLDVAHWAFHYREVALRLEKSRRDVSETITASLAAFFVPARAAALVELYERDAEGSQIACALVDAFGGAIVPGLAGILADAAQQKRAAAALSLMSLRAALLAPAVARALDAAPRGAVRGLVKVLGLAGAGHEGVIAAQLAHADEQVAREAFRALAKIGTAHAASLVARHVQDGSSGRRAAAEEALWHFPAPRAAVQVRTLLGNHEFVAQYPDAAARLLARAAHNGTEGLEAVLAELEPMRFHFWNPAIVRVGLKARELRSR